MFSIGKIKIINFRTQILHHIYLLYEEMELKFIEINKLIKLILN